MVTRAILIPLLPLAAFVINIFFGRTLKEKAAWVAILASIGSCALAATVILPVMQGQTLEANMTWLVINNHPVRFGILVDPVSAMMLFVVTFIGSLIVIYSVGYMHHDPRFPRFFAYLSIFLFSMLGLVLSSSLIQIYVFWELVGLCSYFLIGFWFEKPSAAEAGRKAFITNRIGDIGFFLGIATLFYATGTVEFSAMHHGFAHAANGAVLTLAALLLFCGTVGKSAQFPLHVWLPDAMEGPTPVSALIHAATMVAGGVYLLARLSPLLAVTPAAAETIAIVGTGTALMAAYIALTQTDIKKVLAYSTVSQLGFMVAAMGMGGTTAGAFHLMTHAFFKALLFLGAGSVIHGSGVQDIQEMGGLRKSMPVTFWTFLIATLAIAGVPPLAGFWSKDEILAGAFDSHRILFWILMVTAGMTSFYMFRLLFLTFFGSTRGKLHPHESPAVMTFPLIILAFGSALIGLPGSPFLHHWFQNFIHGHPETIEINTFVMSLSVLTSALGLVTAVVFYLVNPAIPKQLAERYWPIYASSKNKLWMDEFYQATVIKWFKSLAGWLFGFDQKVVDRAVNEAGVKTVWTSHVKDWIDRTIVDGAVNAVGWITRGTSAILRFVQTGFIQNYLFALLIGVLIVVYNALR